MKAHLAKTYFPIIQSFWNCAQSTAVILPCSVQNFKTIKQKTNKLWTNKISQNLSLRWASEVYTVWQQPRAGWLSLIAWISVSIEHFTAPGPNQNSIFATIYGLQYWNICPPWQLGCYIRRATIGLGDLDLPVTWGEHHYEPRVASREPTYSYTWFPNSDIWKELSA